MLSLRRRLEARRAKWHEATVAIVHYLEARGAAVLDLGRRIYPRDVLLGNRGLNLTEGRGACGSRPLTLGQVTMGAC
jgi:hypothetical protein